VLEALDEVPLLQAAREDTKAAECAAASAASTRALARPRWGGRAPMSARKAAGAAQAPRNPSRPSTAGAPKPDDPSTWPIVWRVTAPAAGGYDHDVVFLEAEQEEEARERLEAVRESGFPARLERVACGPLPGDPRAAPGGRPRREPAAPRRPRPGFRFMASKAR
jgi:hypothetical protein